MIEVTKHIKELFGKEVATTITQIGSLEVEVGTNGYHGGGAKDGGRTYLRIQNCDDADIRVRKLPGIPRAGLGEGIEIVFGGNNELESVINAIKFAVDTLESNSKMHFAVDGMAQKVKEKRREIDGNEVLTFIVELDGFCYTEVEVGTNGYRYIDTSFKSRTYIRIQDRGGTVIHTRKLYGAKEGAEIILEGDAELSMIGSALRFIETTLSCCVASRNLRKKKTIKK